MKKDLVLYHGNCYDGFGAAFSAWKKLGNSATYIDVHYGQEITIPKCKRLYILDFSYDWETLVSFLDEAEEIFLIDHHITAYHKLKKFIGTNKKIHISFNIKKSGAYLAWEFFHNSEPPELIKYISDRDLGLAILPLSDEINLSLQSYPRNFLTWNNLKIDNLRSDGVIIKKFFNQTVQNAIKNSWVIRMDNSRIPITNTSFGWSEICFALMEKYNTNVSACFTVREEYIQVSLRSRNGYSCSEIALKNGGGGHKDSAGFLIPISELETLLP
tara:strand:+ start:9517 stop:10332 length:816 start_codon:yes stop_codon:yes gene_type:complete